MDRAQRLLEELKKSFAAWRAKAKFHASFEELDEVFFLQDYILGAGFVSPRVNRMVCARMRDTVNSWIQKIHSWLVPSPYSLIDTSEHQLFSEEEQEELKRILHDFMAVVTLSVEVGLTKEKEAAYVDTTLATWRKHRPQLARFVTRVRAFWEGRADGEQGQERLSR